MKKTKSHHVNLFHRVIAQFKLEILILGKRREKRGKKTGKTQLKNVLYL